MKNIYSTVKKTSTTLLALTAACVLSLGLGACSGGSSSAKGSTSSSDKSQSTSAQDQTQPKIDAAAFKSALNGTTINGAKLQVHEMSDEYSKTIKQTADQLAVLFQNAQPAECADIMSSQLSSLDSDAIEQAMIAVGERDQNPVTISYSFEASDTQIKNINETPKDLATCSHVTVGSGDNAIDLKLNGEKLTKNAEKFDNLYLLITTIETAAETQETYQIQGLLKNGQVITITDSNRDQIETTLDGALKALKL